MRSLSPQMQIAVSSRTTRTPPSLAYTHQWGGRGPGSGGRQGPRRAADAMADRLAVADGRPRSAGRRDPAPRAVAALPPCASRGPAAELPRAAAGEGRARG